MEEVMQFKGHFKIESFDTNNNRIDVWEDNNMIMTGARTTMADLLAARGAVSIDKFTLGTMGHVLSANTNTPKTAGEGFVRDRDRMFSESANDVTSPRVMGQSIAVLNVNDIYYVKDTTPGTTVVEGYYRFIGTPTTNYVLSEAKMNSVEWELVDATAPTATPYSYPISFTLPNTDGLATGVTEPDNASSSVEVTRTGTSLQFIFNVESGAANTQYSTPSAYSAFTEAALYAGGRIFAMKTFKNKGKDSSVLLKITWTITF